MQQFGLPFLIALLVLSGVIALLPTPQTEEVGVTLQGVTLALYPSRDEQTIWRFKADHVQYDPQTSTTKLTQVQEGERLVRLDQDQFRRDATIQTSDLNIDAQDNLSMQHATLYLLQHCAEIELSAPNSLVKIEQANGFRAPVAEMKSPQLNGHIENLHMSFDFAFLEGADPERSHFTYDLESQEQCVNGKRVPL